MDGTVRVDVCLKYDSNYLPGSKKIRTALDVKLIKSGVKINVDKENAKKAGGYCERLRWW